MADDKKKGWEFMLSLVVQGDTAAEAAKKLLPLLELADSLDVEEDADIDFSATRLWVSHEGTWVPADVL